MDSSSRRSTGSAPNRHPGTVTAPRTRHPGTPTTRRAGLPVAALLVALLVTALAQLAGVARAGEARAADAAAPATTLTTDDLGLTAIVGFGGQAVRYQWMPVVVRLAPTSLFSGTIEVATSTGVTETREVEVAGNAVKQFTFVVPAGSVRVRAIPTGSDEAVQLRPDVDGRPNGALVGIASDDGTVPSGLSQIEIVATDERVVWVPADPAILELTHLAVTSLATLVLEPEDVSALSQGARDNLQRAVLDGLNLVVVAPAGDVDLDLPLLGDLPATRIETGGGSSVPTVAGVGDAWTLAASAALDDPSTAGLAATDLVAASVPAGHGRLAITGIAPDAPVARAAWAHLASERDASSRLDGEHTNQGGWIAQQAISSGGTLDVPSLRLLALFALVYLLAAGPGNALLLRRLGRRELGWVTIPAITVAFVAIAFGVASGTQPKVGLAGGTASWVDGLGEETVVAAVRAPSAGEHHVLLPGPDWSVRGTIDFGGGAVDVDRASGDVRSTLDLQALQVGLVIGQRPTDEAAPLDIDVQDQAGGDVRVEVTNLSTRTLRNLELRVGGHHVKLGDLGPGEAAGNSVDVTELNQLAVYVDIFQDARRFDGRVEAPQSLRALLAGTALADRPGRIVVVADDPDAESDVRADGSGVESIGRAIAVATTWDGAVSAGTDVSPAEVDRALLVSAFTDAWQPSPHAVEGQLTAHLRYRLPARAAGRVDQVVPDVDRGEGFVENMGLLPEAKPEILPQGERCITIEDRFPDGSVSSSGSCGDVDPEPPACPEDAVSCEFGVDFWSFEFDDGRTQTGRIEEGGGISPPGFPVPVPNGGGNASQFIEVYDHAAGRWEPLEAGDGTVGIPATHVSPLGEVHLRISGGLFPFDYSARGVGATLQGTSA